MRHGIIHYETPHSVVFDGAFGGDDRFAVYAKTKAGTIKGRPDMFQTAMHACKLANVIANEASGESRNVYRPWAA